LPKLVGRLLDIPGVEEVVMTTNGMLLSRFAPALVEAGLKEVTVSLDTLDSERFRAITRRGDLASVLGGIEAAGAAGLAVKLNAVVIRGFNEDEVVPMAAWALDRGHLLRFIEFMPVGSDTIWGSMPHGGCVAAREIRDLLASRWTFEPIGFRANAGPARYLKFTGAGPLVHGVGHIGIIAAVTECFCSTCNRVRLTPQGGLRACLADDRETDLRALLRGGHGDEAVVQAMETALWGKKETHRFDIQAGNVTMKQMVSIGG
jgi:cyclic pyranopterin phosphate synthase